MRIRIQHSETRMFLKGDAEWDFSAEAARIFRSSIEAFRHCAEHHLLGVNLVVERPAPRAPVLIPVEFNPHNGHYTTGFPVAVSR